MIFKHTHSTKFFFKWVGTSKLSLGAVFLKALFEMAHKNVLFLKFMKVSIVILIQILKVWASPSSNFKLVLGEV